MADPTSVSDPGPTDDEPAKFTGEEGGEERSTPTKNLAASAVIALFGIVVMFLSTQMLVPDTLATAPGLLPFLTGASLVLMALGLATKSIRAGALRGNRDNPARENWFANFENRRTLLLMTIIFAYVVAVDSVWFEFDIPLGIFVLPYSSFEALSALALLVILKIFWKASVLRCALVAMLFSMAVANIFRFGFGILLPGSA